MADRMFRALVCCRAGVGSSTMLKIKCDQVIKEFNLPIETEHGDLDALKDFSGDLVVTMSDLTDELAVDPRVPYVVGVRNIVDKAEIKAGLVRYLAAQGIEATE